MKKTRVAVAIATALGTSGGASADDWVLTDITTFSNNGSSPLTLSGTITFTSDGSNNLTSDGAFDGAGKVGMTPLFTWNFGSAWAISAAGASTGTFTCTEGLFGGVVGASICGNYTFGANGYNESTVNPDGSNKVLGGDDADIGAAQSIADFQGYNLVAGDPATASFTVGNPVESNAGNPGPDEGGQMTFTRPGEAVDDPSYGVTAGAAGESLNIGANDLYWAPNPDVTGPATGSEGGSFAIVPNADMTLVEVTYTPVNPAFTGPETWTYTVTDTEGPIFDVGITPTDMATVTVNVSVAGTANPDQDDTDSLRTPVEIAIGANDVGFADPSSVTVTVNATQGDVTINNSPGAPGGITATYQSTAALGSAAFADTFTYEIGDGVVNDTAVVSVNVNNTVPIANDLGGITLDTQGVDPTTVSTDVNVGPGGDIAGNELGDAPSVVMTMPANDVTTSVNGTVITITASAFTSASDAVGYTITDVDTEGNTGTIAVSIPDVAPTVANVSETIAFAGPYSVSMPFTAGNGAVSQHSISVSQPQFGTIDNVVVDVGVITFDYTPGGFSGPDVITVSLTDGDGSVGTGTATLTMTGSAVTIPPQDSLPGSSSSSALSPATLGLLLSIPLLLRGRRRKRED